MYNLNTQYKSYWLSIAEDKQKGSGIGILVDRKCKKYVDAVKKVSKYIMKICIYFRQLKLVIVRIYIPPNDKISIKKV